MTVWMMVPLLTVLGVAPLAGAATESGEDLYRSYCWQCHGQAGDGMGINVRDMSVQPRNHRDAEAMSGRSDEELSTAIREGGPAISKSVLMPAWGRNLSDDEITALVGYLRRLCQCQHGG